MSAPRLLDWFCCQGGASRGYEEAGFAVYGIDAFREHGRRGYPYPAWKGDALVAFDAFLAGEALTFVSPDGTREDLALDAFDAHAGSPPCQHASAGTRAMRAAGDTRHPALIEPTRKFFCETGKPYVIENVSGAALHDPITLCWSMFHDPAIEDIRNEDGVLLRMERHRLFESNVALRAPRPCRHDRTIQVAGAYGAAQRTIAGAKRRGGGYVPSREAQQRLLGVDWMSERAMHQCIPPIYALHLGTQLLEVVR